MNRFSLRLASLSVFAGTISVLAAFQTARAVGLTGITNCPSSAACVGGSNTGSGPGVYAGSAGGNGLLAQTSKVANSAANGANAVLGQDLSTVSYYNTGIRGTTMRGIGVAGAATVGIGIEGTATGAAGVGVIGTSTASTGILGSSRQSTAIDGITFAPNKNSSVGSYGVGSFGVEGLDASTDGGINNAGVYGRSSSGIGVMGFSRNIGVYAVSPDWTALEAVTYGAHTTALMLSSNSDILEGYGSNGGHTSAIYADNAANLHITGELYTEGGCSHGCSRSHAVRSYGTSATTPSLEDTGEAQLRNGAAYVPLDPAYASAIDPSAGYVVLVTPEADTRGLFVATRSANGFVVRELMGGRSNLAFAYRIVAHPYGEREPRLPLVARKQPETR